VPKGWERDGAGDFEEDTEEDTVPLGVAPSWRLEVAFNDGVGLPLPPSTSLPPPPPLETEGAKEGVENSEAAEVAEEEVEKVGGLD